MIPLLQKMLVFLVLMLVGYIGARRGMLGQDFARSASKLTLNVFMSATILYSVVNNPPVMDGKELAWSLLVAFLVLALGYVVSALITRLLPLKKERAPIFELLVSVMNPMFIGVPVAELLLGSQGVFYIALQNAFFNLLLFTYGVWRLKAGDRGKLRLGDIVTVPLIVTVLGVVIFALRLPCPAFLKDMLAVVSPATMPMSMVVIGASLGRVRLIEAFTEKSLYLAAALRLLLMPVLTWLMFLVLPADPVLRSAMLIVSACPSGIIVSILCIQHGKDYEYSSKGILLDTALSMLTIPLMAAVLL
jgi:predicted permease